MAITYPLSLPQTRAEAALRFGGRANAAVTPSPFSFREEVQVWQGQKWFASCSLRPMLEPDARLWIAFLLSLNGREGTFLMGDPLRTSPRGAGTGTPLVNGAGQTGQSLVTDGWTPSTLVLRAGDYIQLGSGSTATLHAVLADVTANGSGQATLDIWPRLRTSPSDNAPITLTNPMGRWRLAVNDMAWDVQSAQRYGLSFSAEEAL